ncbi:MAG: thiamine phosphate synthase [Proteobacteria bacterium]|nr:thiamine phosphate synthase [Pseudomonadota bacterium]
MGSRPARPILCLVLDRAVPRHPLPAAVRAAVAAGVDQIQIRARELGSSALLAFAREIQSAAGEARVVVNQRADVALALGAGCAGVHLGFDGMTPERARALLGDPSWIGVSAHSPDEVARAAASGASYAQLAPIFQPLSKTPTESRPALGLEPLRRACEHGIPVLAQGGIDTSNAADVIAAGAAGVAVTGAILMADDPGAATAALRRALDRASEC